MRPLLCIVLTLYVVTATAQSDAFDFFHPSVVLRPEEREALDRAAPVVALPRATGREIVVFSAIAIDRMANDRRVTAWMRQLEQLRRNEYVIATGRFSTSPNVGDLEGLTLDRDDLDGIKNCRPGRCDVKLSRVEIEELRRVIATSGEDWRSAVQTAFREIVVRRVSAYSTRGHAGLDHYADHRVARSPSQAFSCLLANSTFLHQRIPGVIDRIATCPAASIQQQRGFMYWSKERLGGKTVISATHVVFVAPNTTASDETLIVGIQIFATHYLDASLGVTAIVPDAASSKSYLVYVNRSDVDILGGFWGGVARSLIEARLRRDGPAILEAVRDRLTKTDPPAAPNGDALPPRR